MMRHAAGWVVRGSARAECNPPPQRMQVIVMANDIRNCKPVFRFQCQNSWDSLELTGRESIRYCSQCHEKVYYCETDAEMIQHAEAGHCVARQLPGLPKFIANGWPELAPNISREDRDALMHEHIEGAKARALEDVGKTKVRCPQCGFPEAELGCSVCGVAEHYKQVQSRLDSE